MHGQNSIHLHMLMRPTYINEKWQSGQQPQKEGLRWSNTQLTHEDFNPN